MRVTSTIKFFAACSCLFICVGLCHAADYYVAKNGNDNWPGTEAQPWRTIQKAASTLVAGDTVFIKAGTYQEIVVPQNSGSAGNYITYTAYSGDTVTIDGNGITVPDNTGLFYIGNRSYIKVSGLRVINAGPYNNSNGIYVTDSSHVTIENNYTYNTKSSGIGVWSSSNITIDSNEVQLACNDGEQECITVATTNLATIKNNHVHHGGPGTNGAEGIDAKDGSSNVSIFKNYVHDLNRLGIYIDAWNKHTYNIVAYQNRVHNCMDGFVVASEMGGLLENVFIYNNIAYDNQYTGLTFSDQGSYRPMNNITVINNTFYNNGEGSWGLGISIADPDVQNVVIRNNILSQNLSQIEKEPGVPSGNLTIDHNLIDGPTDIYGTDYVTGNPNFVNPSGADFHLQNGSPAIDKGSSSGAPSDDFDGNPRPRGASCDIGAFESQLTGSAAFPITGIADVNGDGREDLALLKKQGEGDHNLYYYNAPVPGDRTYWDALARNPSPLARDLWVCPAGNDAIAIAPLDDVNGDGRNELAVLKKHGVDDLNLYCYGGMLEGDWSYWDALARNPSPYARDLWVIPAGNDAVGMTVGAGASTDLLFMLKKDRGNAINLYCYNSPVEGDWTYWDALARNPSPSARDLWVIPSGNDALGIIAVDDMNGDGREELAVTKAEGASDVNLYYYNAPEAGDWTYWDAVARNPSPHATARDLWVIPSGNGAVYIAAVDLTLDGYDELAVLKQEDGGDLNLYCYRNLVSGDWTYWDASARNPSPLARDFWIIPSRN